ncbi:outer envelope pore protein 24B, chloroplastic-like [Hibiscus syriacus]|uniref:outer envelope pore protein 24B, chloroplastic-like n=1 Tax=Hibiscus syriacus TaxID=106335 RepID=UPI001924AE4A|nr:outer envelope pore protein 24B, chloroplastic-like [Hibiscus syriacus]
MDRLKAKATVKLQNLKLKPLDTTPVPLSRRFPFSNLKLRKIKASLKGRYTNDKSTAVVILSVNAGDLKLRSSMTDVTVVKGPSLNGLTLDVEKPDFFITDYDVPKKNFRFQFMNSVRVADKPLKLTYIHSRRDNRTVVDGSLAFDSANKLSTNYMLGTRNYMLKYSYMHKGVTTLESCYD